MKKSTRLSTSDEVAGDWYKYQGDISREVHTHVAYHIALPERG